MPILVPYDFTTVSDFAIEHAVRISNMFASEIMLIHVMKPNDNEDTILDRLRLTSLACQKKYGIRPGIILKVGNINTAICEVANNIQAKVVIMGTHGLAGFQKISTSRAQKVLSCSKVPFIIVQSPPNHNYLKRIVVPVDFKTETSENIAMILNLAKLYRSEVIIYKDSNFNKVLQNKTEQTYKYIVTKLKNIGINVTSQTHSTKDSFWQAAIKFTGGCSADLIAISTENKNNLLSFNKISEKQIIANNYKIPVMCVNIK